MGRPPSEKGDNLRSQASAGGASVAQILDVLIDNALRRGREVVTP
jgi:hypothetical protein